MPALDNLDKRWEHANSHIEIGDRDLTCGKCLSSNEKERVSMVPEGVS